MNTIYLLRLFIMNTIGQKAYFGSLIGFWLEIINVTVFISQCNFSQLNLFVYVCKNVLIQFEII